jgi:hypothetical protein
VGEPRRGPGRPRKWASDAERAKAYRERRKQELAAPEALRVEVRELRRQVAAMTDALVQRDTTISKLQREVNSREREVRDLTTERDRNQDLIRRLVADVQAARASNAAQPAIQALTAPAAPGQRMSRAERRAAERRKRKAR